MNVKKKIAAAFLNRGIIIQKTTPLNSEEKILAFLLKKHNVDLVLDVGANRGQFAMDLLKSRYKGRLVSFEPLPAVYADLKKNAGRYKNWQTENLALGETTGSIEINVSANTESSSVLPILDRHTELAPESKYVQSVTVPLSTLDAYLTGERQTRERNIFLKIDVQGYEEAVLNGAVKTLKNVTVLQLEISFIPLYGNSPVYYRMMEKIENLGFAFYSFLPAFTDYKTGQIFQVDALYVKR